MSDTSQTPANWMRAQAQTAKPLYRQLQLANLLQSVAIVLQAWVLAMLANELLFGEPSTSLINTLMLVLLPLIALRFWARGRELYFASEAGLQLQQQIRAELMQKLQALGPIRLRDFHSAELANLLQQGIQTLQGYYAGYLPAQQALRVLPLLILILVLPGDWLSGLVLICTAPLIPLFMVLIGKGAERLNQQHWQELSRLSVRFLDALQNLATLKWFQASGAEISGLSAASEQYRLRTMSVLRVAFVSSAVLEFIASLSIALIAVFIGFALLADGEGYRFGLFVLLLAPEFYLPLRQLGAQNHARMEALAVAEKIHPILQLETAEISSSNPQALARVSSLHWRDVAFQYEAGRAALQAFSFEFQQGQHVAIVGESGAGKSTLASLMLGFLRPDQGQILLDDQPLTVELAQAWRGQMAWIPQQSQLLPGTVAENIALGFDSIEPERLRYAAEQAQALEFIKAMPEQFETRIGETGRGLSGGQQQRIALARAWYRQAQWILLDEPVAHLDAASESAVLQSLQQLRQQATLITIAHRLHTIDASDWVLVLEQGRLVQQGRKDELLQQAGRFRDLWQQQQVLA